MDLRGTAQGALSVAKIGSLVPSHHLSSQPQGCQIFPCFFMVLSFQKFAVAWTPDSLGFHFPQLISSYLHHSTATHTGLPFSESRALDLPPGSAPLVSDLPTLPILEV